MARSLMALLTLCAVVCASGHDLLDDNVALHQQLARLHAASEELGHGPPLEEPSKQMAAKVKPMIRQAVDGAIQRATSKLHSPNIPAVFRWDLVGKITQWAMTRYQKPKSAAALELTDDLISFYTGILGSKDFPTLEDKELESRLSDVNKLQEIARHYMDKVGAPPSATKLFDSVAEAARSKSTVDAQATAQLIVDMVNQTSGPALADLVAYLQAVSLGKVQFDEAHALDLEVPAVTKLGAPPAVADFLQETASMHRQQIVPESNQEGARVARMLAKSAEQLGMPPALSETFSYTAGALANASNSHLFEKPEEQVPVLAHLNGLMVKLNDQLGGLKAVSQLIALLGRPLNGESMPAPDETLGLLAQCSREAAQPGTVTELLEFMVPIVAKKQTADSEKGLDLLLRLNEELGLPAAATKVIRDARAQAQRNGGSLDPEKLTKLATQLLRKMGMPAFADIFSHVATPLITKGKAPDALALAVIAPSLMKVPNDFDTAAGLAKGTRAKLLGPLLPVYDRVVENLIGKMPESFTKTAFKGALNAFRPKVEE